MKSTVVVRGRQLLALLIISRILFSTDFIPALSAGNSLQDILPAVPVVFLLNLILAFPMIVLLKRHPNRDFVECSMQALGKGPGYIVCLLVYGFLLLYSASTLCSFGVFYTSLINQDISVLFIFVTLLAVAVYGAIKGIETLARFGLVVMIIYLLVLILISVTMLPISDTDNLKPLFYSGPRVFIQTILSGVNMSVELMLLAMCTPFIRQQDHFVRVYVIWDVLAMLFWFLTLLLVVVVLGPFGSKQLFPLGTLVTNSKLSTFQRLDAIDLVSWVLEAVLMMGFYIFAMSQCLMRTFLRKWRRSCIAVSAVLCGVLAYLAWSRYNLLLYLYDSPYTLMLVLGVLFALPVFVLLCDVVKEKVNANAQ